MFSDYAFFSFLRADSPESRHEYNLWGVMDHTPENRKLKGVAIGDRWERPICYQETLTGDDPEFASLDFLTMYWFRPPHKESVAEFNKLAEDTFQWGRGALIPGISRALAGFFYPVKGYSAAGTNVTPDVVPFLPNRGLYIEVEHFESPHSVATHEHYTWQDQQRIPDLLTCSGVSGAWTFSLAQEQEHPTLPLSSPRGFEPTSIRVLVLYLDEDPREVAEQIAQQQRAWDTKGRGQPHPEAVRRLFASPLRTINPWEVVQADPTSETREERK